MGASDLELEPLTSGGETSAFRARHSRYALKSTGVLCLLSFGQVSQHGFYEMYLGGKEGGDWLPCVIETSGS